MSANLSITEKISLIVGALTIVGFGASAVLWATNTYAITVETKHKVHSLEVYKVPHIKETITKLNTRVGNLESIMAALEKRQCLMLDQLGIKGHDCYTTP